MTGSRNRERTRAAVIAAAITLFSQRGYAGASIEAIARESGMTIGALYSNFSGKRDLFLQALRTAVGRTEENTEDAIAGDGGLSATDRLLADGSRYMKSVDRDPQGFRLLLWSIMEAEHDDEVREVVTAVLREQRTVQAEILRQLERERGPLRLRPTEVATTLNSMAIGYSLQRMLDPRSVSRAGAERALGQYVESLPRASDGDES